MTTVACSSKEQSCKTESKEAVIGLKVWENKRGKGEWPLTEERKEWGRASRREVRRVEMMVALQEAQ